MTPLYHSSMKLNPFHEIVFKSNDEFLHKVPNERLQLHFFPKYFILLSVKHVKLSSGKSWPGTIWNFEFQRLKFSNSPLLLILLTSDLFYFSLPILSNCKTLMSDFMVGNLKGHLLFTWNIEFSLLSHFYSVKVHILSLFLITVTPLWPFCFCFQAFFFWHFKPSLWLLENKFDKIKLKFMYQRSLRASASSCIQSLLPS